MNENDEQNSFESSGDAESLDPAIASANDPDDDTQIISNMNYNDYLNAVYSYEEKAAKKAGYDRKLLPMQKLRDTKKAKLEALERSLSDNREQRSKIHDDAIADQHDKWQKVQDRLDVQISQQIGTVKQQAEAEVNKKKEEYLKEVNDFNEKVNYLKHDILRLDNERKEIEIYRNKYDDYSIDFIPVADEGVLELLETARDKRWLTAYHRELLKTRADKVCDKRIHTFEELEEREIEFAGSQMVEDIRKGEVTREVIAEFSKRAGAVCGIAAALMGMIAAANPGILFFAVLQAAASSLFIGGMSLDIGRNIARKKNPRKKEISKVQLLSVGAAFLGGAAGFLIWATLLAGNQNPFVFIYTLIASAGTGFLFKHILTLKFMEGLLKRLPFLKNRARYYVFKNYAKAENGKYNLQIYCYLNHNLVLHYLSIKHKDMINEDIDNKLKQNREFYKNDRKELVKMSERKQEIIRKRQEFRAYAKKRKEQLLKDISIIEARRGDVETIDFEAKLPQNISSELIRLDAEYEDIRVEIENTQRELKIADEQLNNARKKYGEVSREYTLIEEALRYWYKTPVPSATHYKMLDAFCFESKKQLSIIHHNLRPLAFRYAVRMRSVNPSEHLRLTIFKYIRGLIKINPSRMIQVNIIDPVSDPDILLEDRRFEQLTGKGVIRGVYSVSDFEIRLFTNEREYNTFKSIFKTQCIEIQRILSKNSHLISEGEPYSLELANKIKHDDSEPFMYQIMMFIVPRESDRTQFEPPSEIIRAMDNGTYFNMGLLPIFFVDNDSIHSSWRKAVDMCPEECIVKSYSNSDRK